MSVVPLLRCNSLNDTRDFYRALPGFSAEATAEGTLTVAGLGARLVFTAQDLWQSPPVFSGTFYFTVDDIDSLFAQLGSSVTVSWPPQDMGYGSREFGIRDCNGYTLAFQQARG
ncbi:MAG TPA: VOC family protein [Moraxellaceae bacterium]